jgi:hypothetical protein
MSSLVGDVMTGNVVFSVGTGAIQGDHLVMRERSFSVCPVPDNSLAVVGYPRK